VASLRLLGAALEVRVELADGDRVATVAGRLPELAAALEALGLRAAASATPARAATLDGGDAPVRRPAATGFALWA
jgi:hypothetical protein